MSEPIKYEPLNHHEEIAEEGEPWLISYADLMTILFGFFVMLQSFSKIDSEFFESVKKETTKVFGGEYKVPYENLTNKLKEAVGKNLPEGEQDQILFENTPGGVTVTFRGALFFDSGSTFLKDEAKNLMSQIIPIISVEAKDFGIVIEGHTDNQPIISRNPASIISSNWELSSLRACTVLRLFEEAGFPKANLKALGWGDTKPIVPNEDSNRQPIEANQAQNRRVVVKILKDTSELKK